MVRKLNLATIYPTRPRVSLYVASFKLEEANPNCWSGRMLLSFHKLVPRFVQICGLVKHIFRISSYPETFRGALLEEYRIGSRVTRPLQARLARYSVFILRVTAVCARNSQQTLTVRRSYALHIILFFIFNKL